MEHQCNEDCFENVRLICPFELHEHTFKCKFSIPQFYHPEFGLMGGEIRECPIEEHPQHDFGTCFTATWACKEM